MKVSLVGAKGFIGSYVAQRLRIRGADVLVQERNAVARECDAAIHMFVMNEADADTFVQDFQKLASRLILISSGDVYRAYGILTRQENGPLEPQPLSEASPLRVSRFPYRERPDYEKIAAEQVVLNAGQRNCVLRLPAVYGPGDKHHRIGSWLKRLEFPPVRIGESFARWRWTHAFVENVADAIALVATSADLPSRVYNIGEPETPNMLDRASAWNRAAGFEGPIEVVPDNELPAELGVPYNLSQDLVMDSSKIRNELGFVEIVSEDEALERSVAWEVQIGYARRSS